MSKILNIDNITVNMVDVTGNLVIDYSMRELCTRPYPGHPEGCPNFGNNPQCPPEAPVVEEFIDMGQPHYFLIAEYKMCGNQKRADTWNLIQSVLTKSIHICEDDLPGIVGTLHPSAVGVDVFKTAASVGVTLQSKPATLCGIALIGYPL
jgi:predicted metal-binding protein